MSEKGKILGLLPALVLVPAVKRKLDFHAVKGPAGVEIGYTEP